MALHREFLLYLNIIDYLTKTSNEMENGVIGVSEVNVIPRGNRVLLKIEFETSILSLNNGKPESNADDKVDFTVVGVGPLVADLKIGDKVVMNIEKAYNDVVIESNENSIKKLMTLYQKMPKKDFTELIQSGANKAKVVQYGMFVEYEIPGLYK